MFTDLEAAFEEMEFLVEETNKTHKLSYRENKNGYRVTVTGIPIKSELLICELNCRNLVGQKEINIARGKSVSFSSKRRVYSPLK